MGPSKERYICSKNVYKPLLFAPWEFDLIVYAKRKRRGCLTWWDHFPGTPRSSTSDQVEPTWAKRVERRRGRVQMDRWPECFAPLQASGRELFLDRLHQSLHSRLIFDSHATCIPDKIWAARLLPSWAETGLFNFSFVCMCGCDFAPSARLRICVVLEQERKSMQQPWLIRTLRPMRTILTLNGKFHFVPYLVYDCLCDNLIKWTNQTTTKFVKWY